MAPDSPVDPSIDPSVPPSGPGCVECETEQGWWVHLRRCATCGHVGCCDTSPGQHATEHYEETGHAVIRSYEPGEEWFWDFAREVAFLGPTLADPQHHPVAQDVPGPEGRVPDDWERYVH